MWPLKAIVYIEGMKELTLEVDECRLCARPLNDDEGVGIVGKKKVHWVHDSCRRRYLQRKLKRKRQKRR